MQASAGTALPDLQVVVRRTAERREFFWILWEEQHGWSLYHQSVLTAGPDGPKVLRVFESTNTSAKRCPLDGWRATQVVEVPANVPPPNMRVAEALPWRCGNALFSATPDALRSPLLLKQVESLPPWQPPPSGPRPAVTMLPGGRMTISVPVQGGPPACPTM
eukprot:SRR837773.7855.p1 GENE.SRR837773.7855~~SRR837773.7855.p1  ORF type:complete len:162 (+),score=5.03 SRR837773.7855:1-486(+)